jgi:tyrosine phenol-lyase
MPRPIIEPFRVKVVEPIKMTTPAERQRILERAGYNLFGVRAEDVIIDLLTDSGTGAMSAEQWAGIMRGDESYAGARSYFRFEEAACELTGMPLVYPTHQGRAAERILCAVLPLRGRVVLSNGLFDTTRANIEEAGAQGVDLPVAGGDDRNGAEAPFAGNMDLAAFDAALVTDIDRVALVVMTVTNNTVGGQAVSLANLRAVSERCHARKVPLFLDACRFAENAWAIRQGEPAERQRTLASIAREMFDLCDGFTMSAKKDAIVNMGGMLGVRDEALSEKIRVDLIRTEGFPTYGGLAGRDLEAIAQGLREVLDESYLEYRFAASRYLADALSRGGWPVIQPAAAHAVYIDAGAALPHLTPHDLPGQSVACAFYLAGGVRTCEIGSLMFGDTNAKRQLVRLALPRRVYTQSHIDYVAAIGQEVAAVRDRLPAMRIVKEAPCLRHFSAALAPVSPFPEVRA